jgi:lysophospholipase L1-like esterase
MNLPWSRYVALGDSLTEGVGDPVAGALRGWADRLAQALRTVDPELEFVNLGRRSLRTRHVRDRQLPQALELRPDLASVVVGMNDLLAVDFDARTYQHTLDDIVGPLTDSGATVMMGTFPEHLPVLRLAPRRFRSRMVERLADASEAVRQVAAERGAICLDAPEGWRYSMSDCSVDGCHPNARGHALIAQRALESLKSRFDITRVSIDHSDCGLIQTSVGHVRWLAAEGFFRRPPGLVAWWKEGRA